MRFLYVEEPAFSSKGPAQNISGIFSVCFSKIYFLYHNHLVIKRNSALASTLKVALAPRNSYLGAIHVHMYLSNCVPYPLS